MGELMRSLDWSQTPLGPVDQWPQSLKTSISTCLNSRFAILVWWGKHLVKLYNDAYIPILGIKHPHALGAPGKEVWPEIWHIIGPMLEGVIERGEATWSDNLLLELERNGYPEECYFTFSYSPIRDESGGVGGIFTPVQETTAQVIGERRLRMLRDLAEGARGANTENTEHVCQLASSLLASNPQDIPFAASYLFSRDGTEANVCSTAGVSGPTPLLPETIVFAESDWLFAEAARTGEMVEVAIPPHMENVPCGAWPVPPTQAVVVPIDPAGHRIGFLVLGVSPRKRLDGDYRSFLSLIGGHVTTAVGDARALEEERKRAAALAQLDYAKTQFFSNVSHEFRTPLTLLLGPLEDLLADGSSVGTEVKKTLQVAHRNALRLLRLVNSLLDFSRLEAGRTRAVYVPTELGTFTSELASTFRSATERAGLEFKVECQELPEPIYVDREMWEAIVLNLLSNAFKFTMKGQISVRLRQAGDSVELEIRDTGIGIPTEEMPRLFERFHRVEGSHGRSHEGTGIGLALVEELVQLHGGTIRVQSVPGQGSSFVVSLPRGKEHLPSDRVNASQSGSTLVRSEAYVEEALRWLPATAEIGQESTEQTTADDETRKRQRQKILLVDDNADMRQYLQRLLGDRYAVIPAADGLEALALAQREKPDLILSDVMMPGLDGHGLLQALRAEPSTRSIPFILLSARAGEEAQSHGMDSGADDYLVKPFSARELRARIAAHLNLAQARKDTREQATRVFAMESRRWRDLFAQVPAAVAVLRGPEHRFEWVNDDYVRLVNRASADELLNKTLSEALPEIASVGYNEIFDRVFQTGEPHAKREIAVALGNPKAETVYVSFVCLPTRGADGRIDGTFVHATDVTDMVETRKQIEESEQQFRTLAESIPNLAWMADETGNIFWYNRRWYEFTGTTLDDVSGFKWERVHDPAVFPEVLAQWTKSVVTGVPFEMVFPLRGANGAYRQFLTRVEPVKDHAGRVVRWFGTNTDVSDQRKTEQELRRMNRELEEFAYVASHDLREPLRMVNIYTQLIVKRLGDQSSSINQYVDYVRQGVSRMEALIDDLLVFSRTVQADEEPLGRANLENAYRQAIGVLKTGIEETGATVTASALPVVRGDESQLVQVFQNLIANALKYRKDGTAPRVEITAARQGDKWVITVADNGIGFEQQYATRIFGLFKRLHKDRFPGTGLGLAICQRVIERYGGRIWAEGKLGVGSRFYFELPAADGGTAH